jgi:hypothetical protein
MMANTMEFNNGFNYLGTMPTPPAYGQPNLGQISTRTTSDSQGWLMAYIN